MTKHCNRPRFLSIGSVSHGTMRDEDLIPVFLDVAEGLRLTKDERRRVRAIRRAYERAIEDNDQSYDGGYWEHDAEFDLNEDLFPILNNHCPDYTYFGSHPGDGADYGCWPVEDLSYSWPHQGGYDGCIYRSSDTPPRRKADYPADWSTGPCTFTHWMHVNDHGNVTMYRRAGNRWIECWSVV